MVAERCSASGTPPGDSPRRFAEQKPDCVFSRIDITNQAVASISADQVSLPAFDRAIGDFDQGGCDG